MTNRFGEVFTLDAIPALISASVLKKLVAQLTANGTVRVAFKSDPFKHDEGAADSYLNALVSLVDQYGVTSTVVDKDVLDMGLKGISVHATLRGYMVDLVLSPWHDENLPGGKGFRRIIEMCEAGRTFVVNYTFDDYPAPSVDFRSAVTLEDTLERAFRDLGISTFRPFVISMECYFRAPSGTAWRYAVLFERIGEGDAS